MAVHQLMRALLLSAVVALGVTAAGHQRKTVSGSGRLPSSRTEPIAESTVDESGVEYINSGPLGPLYDFLIRNRLQRFCLLMRKANLEDYLLDGTTWTIFAPTDGSFAFLPGGTLETLERNPQMLRDFLLYHFVAGDLTKAQILDEMVVDSVQGSLLRFNIYGPTQITTVSGAEILQSDLQFELGRVHIIDRPLYPLPQYDLIGYLQTYHNEMYKLIVSAGLVEFLSGGTYTIFAPDDKAFDYLSLDLKDALATNQTLAERVVLTHVLPASMFVRGFGNEMHIASVGNADLLFIIRRGLTFVNDVPILTPDVPVTNGVVHVVNRVLLPEGVDADCQCKPLDASGRVSGRRPYDSPRIPATPRPLAPAAGARPAVRPAAGLRPGVTQGQQRPGTAPVTVPRPSVPSTGTGQRTSSGVLSGHGQRPGTSGVAGLGQRPAAPATQRPGQVHAPSPAPVTIKRKPFDPNRIPQSARPTSSPASTRTQRPWSPSGDTILIELRDEYEPAPTDAPDAGAPIIPGTIPAVVPPRPPAVVSRPGALPGSRFPSQPSHQARQPAHSTVQSSRQPSQPSGRPGGTYPGSPSFEDNTVDVQTGNYPEYDYEPLTQRPGQVGAPQPGSWPGQQRIPQTTVSRPGQHVQTGQRPGQPIQTGQRPGQQIQTGQRPGQPIQTGQRPGQPIHTGQRPGQPIQTGQRPGQPIQTGQRPGLATQTGQRPGQPIQAGQRPGQPTQTGHRPGQTIQTGQRPGQTQLQPIQRPSQQITRPGQQTDFQQGTRPGQSPAPGQQTQFQPSQRPGSTAGGRRPVPPPPTRRTPAPRVPPGQPGLAPPTSAPQQQFVTGRTTSLFPTRRPGQTSHSTKGQTYNPQRHNPQRRPASTQRFPSPPSTQRIPSTQNTRQTASVPAASPGLIRQPFESNRQTPTCRRAGERVTAATQSLPLCPVGDAEFEPCQRLDQAYDPSDPRPPCQETTASCYTPGEATDPSDTRPPCPGIPDEPDCRQPGEPVDYRPLCPQTEASNCRMPLERPLPGDTRPLCSIPGRPAPPVSPQRQTPRPPVRGQLSRPQTGTITDCRRPGDAILPGDQRPACEEDAPSPGTQQTPGSHAPQPGRQPSFQPVPPSTVCRQPGERITPGDRRPLCRVSSSPTRPVSPVGSQVLPPTSGNEAQGPVGCRPVTERPTVGDTRPVCRIPSHGQRPSTPQTVPGRHGSQRPSVPQTIPGRHGSQRPSTHQRPSSQPTSPARDQPAEQPESPQDGDSGIPEQPPATELTPHQPTRGTHAAGRPVSHPGHRGTATQQQRPQAPAQRPWQSPVSGQPVQPLGVDDQLPPANQWDTNGNVPATPAQQPGRPGRPQQSWQTSRTPSQSTTVRRPGSQITGTAVSLPGVTTTTTTTTTLTTTKTSDGPRTLYEIVEDPSLLIQGRPVKLTKIFELFRKAGLEYILTDPGPYTVFLPSDDAFLRLPKGVVEQLESDPNLLQQVLLFHVTTDEILPAPQDQSYFAPSFQGTPILITMLKGGRLILISGAKAVAVTRASNGIFYVINQLIYPLPQDDIVSALSSRPDLKTITTFIEISGLTDYLRDQPYTLFAPSDSAFNQLSEAAVQELMQNTTALRDLLLGHVIAGAHYGREFLSGASFPNMRGGNLKLNTVSFGYQVNNVNIKTPEIVTGGGVIHVIDEVLLTPEDLRFIERLSNALEGVEAPPSSNLERAPPAAPGTQPTNGGWRTQSAFMVTYGRTSTRTQTIPGTQTFVVGSPYPQTGTVVRGTFPVQGSQVLAPGSTPPTGHGTDAQTPGSESPTAGNARPGSSLTHVSGTHRVTSGGGSSLRTSHHSGHQTHGALSGQRGPGQSFGTSGQYSVVQLANDIGLNRFASLITNSGLSDKIEDGGTYTVLAPTDEALNSLPPDVAQALEADPNQLRDLLQYHILPQKLSSSSLGNDETASTLLEGKKLRFNKYNNGQVLTALGVPVDHTQADPSTSVRIIPVNQVLQPPSGSLLKILQNSPDLSEFYSAIKSSHLSWMLNGQSGMTLFAPSNAAFQALTNEQRKDLIENKRNFSDILKSHLVKGTLYTTGLQDGEERRTENRKTIVFTFYDGGVMVNSIPITHADIPATNGVLHIIDHFL